MCNCQWIREHQSSSLAGPFIFTPVRNIIENTAKIIFFSNSPRFPSLSVGAAIVTDKFCVVYSTFFLFFFLIPSLLVCGFTILTHKFYILYFTFFLTLSEFSLSLSVQLPSWQKNIIFYILSFFFKLFLNSPFPCLWACHPDRWPCVRLLLSFVSQLQTPPLTVAYHTAPPPSFQSHPIVQLLGMPWYFLSISSPFWTFCTCWIMLILFVMYL